MSGRGDNNKRGSSGSGSSNQSNQAFVGQAGPQPKSNHAKRPSGGKRSQPDPGTPDQGSERNRSTSPNKK